MKGYKAFDHGMICRGKQYAENTTFEEPEAVLRKSGMHFCANPMDCLMYKDLVDSDGNIVEIAEVECAGKDAIGDGSGLQFVAKKLKIGRKLSFDEWVEVSRTSEDGSRIAASQSGSHLTSSGYSNCLLAIRGNSFLASSGDANRLAARENSIAAAVGAYNRVKAGIGSWIVLAEWEDGKPQCVKAAMIDGEILKPDVWYELRDGEIVPAEYN